MLRKSKSALESILLVRGNVSREFERSVDRILSNVPHGISRLAASSDLKIVAVSTVVDYFPSLRNKQPRGYRAEDTWSHADGVFWGLEAVVAQGCLNWHGKLTESKRWSYALLHELGHGVDYALANACLSTKFVEAFLRDAAKFIGTPVEEKLTYNLQGFGLNRSVSSIGAGLSETFADVFAAVLGFAANEGERLMLLNAFPNVAKFIRETIHKF